MFMLINGECGTIKCPVSTYKLCFSPVPGAGQCRAPGHHWPHAHWAKPGVLGRGCRNIKNSGFKQSVTYINCLEMKSSDKYLSILIQNTFPTISLCKWLNVQCTDTQCRQETVTTSNKYIRCQPLLHFPYIYHFLLFNFEFFHLDFSYSVILWNLGGAGFVQLGDIRIHTTGLSSSTWHKVCIVDEVRPLLIFIL